MKVANLQGFVFGQKQVEARVEQIDFVNKHLWRNEERKIVNANSEKTKNTIFGSCFGILLILTLYYSGKNTRTPRGDQLDDHAILK